MILLFIYMYIIAFVLSAFVHGSDEEICKEWEQKYDIHPGGTGTSTIFVTYPRLFFINISYT